MTLSCKDKNEKLVESNIQLVESKITKTEIKEKADTLNVENGLNEVMKQEDILFNGKLKRYFTIKEFEKVFVKADSIKQLAEEEPCTFIFDTELKNDNSNMNEFLYFYKEGSRFENYKEKIAVDEFRFTNNNFILYKGLKLDKTTTINDLKNIFPKAMNEIGTMDVYGEGDLQVIQLREDENNISDGHINLFLKNGKLYYMHWWFPC